MMDRDVIIERLKEIKPSFDRLHVKRMRLFGSYATGQATKDSDVDILLDFSQTPSLFDLSEIHVRLTKELGTEVDIALADYLLPEFRERILNEAVDV